MALHQLIAKYSRFVLASKEKAPHLRGLDTSNQYSLWNHYDSARHLATLSSAMGISSLF